MLLDSDLFLNTKLKEMPSKEKKSKGGKGLISQKLQYLRRASWCADATITKNSSLGSDATKIIWRMLAYMQNLRLAVEAS